MSAPRDLTSPPIAEALVDLRAAVIAPQASFEALARELRAEFPKTDLRRGIRAELKFEEGRLVPPTTDDLGFQGIHAFTEDGTVVAQFRPDGFTYNNLKSYMGGERLLGEALRLWSKFVEQLQPVTVTRVALRYINQLHLPLRQGDDFSRFLTAAPLQPEGAPQLVSEFLTRVVAHDDETAAIVVTTQQLTVSARNLPLIVIDVDAFRNAEFSTDARELRLVLDGLRGLKNRSFFSLLTDEAVQLFL